MYRCGEQMERRQASHVHMEMRKTESLAASASGGLTESIRTSK